MKSELDEATLSQVIAVYADGGCIKKNPSVIGITWAWCAVNAEDERIIERSGVVPYTTRPLTNNHAEAIALVLALEAMQERWSGHVYSDSQIALNRIFNNWPTKNLPKNIIERSKLAVARLGRTRFTLLQGHPTEADLKRGYGARTGLPVSKHNKWCDEKCTRQARMYLSRLSTTFTVTRALLHQESAIDLESSFSLK